MDSQTHREDCVEKDGRCKKENDKSKKNIWKKISIIMFYIESNRAKIAATAFLTGLILFVLSIFYNVDNTSNISDVFVIMSALFYAIWIFTCFGNISTDIGGKKAIKFGIVILSVAYIIKPPFTILKAILVSVLIFCALYVCVGGILSVFLKIKNTVNDFLHEENQTATNLKNTISNISSFIGVFGGLITAITAIINAIIKIGK